jgi:hypothetical protein
MNVSPVFMSHARFTSSPNYVYADSCRHIKTGKILRLVRLWFSTAVKSCCGTIPDMSKGVFESEIIVSLPGWVWSFPR